MERSRKVQKWLDNPLIICVNEICVNKIENRITFKIKSGYYLELLAPETMKLLGSTENEITKYTNGNDTSFRYYWSNVSSLQISLAKVINNIL